MVALIRDLMRGTTITGFQPDVQISHYRSANNLALLNQYIFTVQAPQNKKPTVDLLRSFCEAYSPTAPENRFVVIANYGHGKSHFALALANFFGSQPDSDVADAVLGRLDSAIREADRPVYGYLKAFKKQHKPFLVLLLRGDEPADLTTQFNRAVKDALTRDEGPDTNSLLPFWFQGAQTFTEAIPESYRGQANAYLAQYHLDLEALHSKVCEGQAPMYEVCVGLHEALYRTRPDFEIRLGLGDAVKWLVSNRCGDGKPYDGILVLFDEFSAFVRNYSLSALPGTPLQDLLNGISNARGRAAFIAFAPHDPKAIARNEAPADKLDNVLKELSRLPKSFELHSSLETVLASYLRKQDSAWNGSLANPAFSKALDEATATALKTFGKRYLQELKWDTLDFHKTMTIGCYPLHPLTTALLCSIELQSAAARTVLGFVQSALTTKADEPIHVEGTPTWIRATYLIDYFGEMLGPDRWQRYREALESLNVADSPTEALVLKAMYVQACGNTAAAGLGYARLIAELAGLPVETAAKTLENLAARGIIRRDPLEPIFTFWTAGPGRGGEELIKRKAAQVKLDDVAIDGVRTTLALLGLESINVRVPWGHGEDWRADQLLRSRAVFTTDYIRGIVKRQLRWDLDPGSREKPRGLVLWAIAESDEAVQWYRDHIFGLLNDGIGQETVPLVVMRPNMPSTALVACLKRLVAIEGFTNQERQEVGTDWFSQMLKQARKDLGNAISTFKADCTMEAPAPFRGRLGTLAHQKLDTALPEIYAMAYPHGPAHWFDHFKLTQAKLVGAVASLSSWLITGTKLSTGLLSNKPVEKDIVETYLNSTWHVVDSHYRVVGPPAASALHKGWSELDKAFAVGAPPQKARAVLDTLLNSPYGYDWNTLALLFATWWSHHRVDLVMDARVRTVLSSMPGKPRDLLDEVSKWTIQRRNPDERLQEIRALVDSIASLQRRSPSQAELDAQKLSGFCALEDEDAELRAKAQEALDSLQDGLKASTDYDTEAKRLLQEAHQQARLDLALSCLDAVSRLPKITVVEPTQPPLTEVRTRLHHRVEELADSICSRYTSLKSLGDYTNNMTQLQTVRKLLEKYGLNELAAKVSEGICSLDKAKEELAEKEQQAQIARDQQMTLQNVVARGLASDLQSAKTTLENMDPQPAVKNLWESKYRGVCKELERLQTVAGSLEERIDRAANQNAVRQIRDDVLTVKQFCDTPELGRLVIAGLTRCEAVSQYLSDLDSILASSRSSPSDFQRAMTSIGDLLSHYGSNLSPVHQELAVKASSSLEKALQDASTRASARLSRLDQALVSGADPYRIQRDTEQAPQDWTFLSQGETERLEALRQRIEQRNAEVREEKDRREREEALRRQQEAEIKAQPHKGPLSQLLQAVAALDAMPTYAKSLPVWQPTRAAIASEIQRLTTFAGNLGRQIDQAVDKKAIETCRLTVSREQNSCDEGDARQSIDNALSRCGLLLEFLEQLEEVRRRPRQSPDDVARDLSQVRDLLAARSAVLSDAHRALGERLLADVEDAQAKERQRAFQRLVDLEEALRSRRSAPDQVLRDLQRSGSQWAFLDRLNHHRLEALRGQAQEEIDGNETQQVELHFKRINNPLQRRECLERLRRLAEELR